MAPPAPKIMRQGAETRPNTSAAHTEQMKAADDTANNTLTPTTRTDASHTTPNPNCNYQDDIMASAESDPQAYEITPIVVQGTPKIQL